MEFGGHFKDGWLENVIMFQPHWCFSPLLVGWYSISEWSQNGLWEPSLCPQEFTSMGRAGGEAAGHQSSQNPKQLKECFYLAPHGAPSPFTFLFELHHLPPGTQWSPWTATLGSGMCVQGDHMAWERMGLKPTLNPADSVLFCTLGLLKSQSTSASPLWKNLST